MPDLMQRLVEIVGANGLGNPMTIEHVLVTAGTGVPTRGIILGPDA